MESIKNEKKEKKLWDKASVKEYNKNYYNKHRTERLNKIKEIVKCEKCCSDITVGRLECHQKTNLCKNKSAKIIEAVEFLKNIISKNVTATATINFNMDYENNIKNIELLKQFQI